MVQNVSIQFAKLFRHHADLFRICNSSHKLWNNRSLTSCTPGRQTHARPLFRLTSPPVCSDQIDADLDRQVLPGLTDRALLEKIDKLRELNVKSLELPQLVAVGDQSSGKSSILESLTGFSFPQAPGLCTRYATQISCRREPRSKVVVSIIPRPNADAKLINRIRSFRRTIPALAKDGLVEIIADASRIMGIKMVPEDADPSLQAFSHDVLKVEINGPDQEHFTVIDVPGIFRYPSPPLTTESDVSLVQDMVESHIRNNRTIILAVLPSNVHISTQEILQMAKTADPYGCSTMGVLTKPDLVTENTSRDIIKDLVSGERNQLRLGYFVVKSRSADDQSLEFSDCLLQEAKFFNDDAWRSVASSGRCGIEPLKARLRDLLTTITKREFPNVIADVAKREKQCQNDLISIGPSRETVAAQRIFLGRIGSRFQAITQRALNGYYEGEHIFDEDPSLKLITNITKLNERFANDMCNQGHKRQVFTSHNNEEGSIYALSDHEMPHNTYNALFSKYHELQHIVVEGDYKGSNTKPLANDSITDHIKQVYQDNRGPNLGTFSGTILAVLFREQSEKWESLVLTHVGKCIMLVHDYIVKLLVHMCPDKRVRSQLWENILLGELQKSYTRAMDQARYLLRIERDGRPSTYNHYFNSEVQKKRLARLNAAISKQASTFYTKAQANAPAKQAVPVESILNLITNKYNMQQMCEDILDVLSSYYKVSRKRFVDGICRHVIGHFLLDAEAGPLRVFSPELVMGLEDHVLEMIAREDADTRNRRTRLEAEIKNLEAAMKLLKT